MLLFTLVCGSVFAVKPKSGFKALAVYDYFKARKTFLKINRKKANAYASYGLATIFYRTDNPFSNLDSAVKYASRSFHLYQAKAKPFFAEGYTVDSASILRLVDSIAAKQFVLAKKANTAAGYGRFLSANYLARQGILKQAVYLRDELEFNRVLQANHSDSTEAFLVTHPQSGFYGGALILKDRQLYDELTTGGRAQQYIAFIKKYPKSAMVKNAHERLFSIYRQNSDVTGLAFFVKNYPKAPQNLEAWKLLFSLSVKAYSFAELKRFLEEYPDFPLKNSILKELELNKLVLYRYQQGDYTGFINEEGKFVIAPAYDAATDFYEGLSVVSKNDSVFYINKENTNPFNRIYSEAMAFHNGIAPVKLKDKWYFINRQGQIISKPYDEINELSNSVYIVRSNDRYGALDQYGQVLIEPQFDKLGDFKNDYAYYTGNGAYGFVSVSGSAHKAEFDWISDFDEQQIAIFKQNNKYGLINGMGKKLLEPQYDLVLKTGGNLFMAVSNNNYGFYNPAAGCFIIQVAYDYQKDKAPEYYTNGTYFRLLKKNGQAIVDRNGHSLISTDTYGEINFISDGLIKVLKKKKYGYLDPKLAIAIPFKYQEAGDFKDSIAAVTLKDQFLLINAQGKEIMASAQGFEKASTHFYLVNSEPKALINSRGEVLLNNVASVAKINNNLLIITLQNGEIKLLND